MKKRRSRFIGILFVSLWLLAAATILLPTREFSPNENRYLAQRPEFSAEAVRTGSFQNGLSDFLSDQIPFRSGWIRVNTAVKKLMGRKEINGIYLGKEHHYFQKFTDDSYSSSRMCSVFRMIDAFVQQQGVPAQVMLVPSPGTVYHDLLPKNAPFYDADRVYDTAEQMLSCPVIDLRETFAQSDEELYYRTDHHWTTRGAEIAYGKYCEAVGLEPRTHMLHPVSTNFRGTLDSKVLDMSMPKDTIHALIELPDVTVTFDDNQVSDTPYSQEKLTEKDQYAFFFGGNWGKVTIDTGSDSGKKLLVIKDSFANSFVPFLFEDYSQIVMLDLRYFHGSVADVMAEQGTSQLLFLYETSNFLTDNGILHLAEK